MFSTDLKMAFPYQQKSRCSFWIFLSLWKIHFPMLQF